MLVTVTSSLSTPPSCQVWRVQPAGGASVQLLPAGTILEPCPFEPPRWLPQLHQCQLAAGDTLFCCVYPPAGYVPGRRYPTVLNVYGGPQVQVVANTFKVGPASACSVLVSGVIKTFCAVAVSLPLKQYFPNSFLVPSLEQY